ncbi:hypothetical protein C8Q77DRAFT_1220391 [Trametes polyzona]|nr:hypothetical protein C8Q77DRAFT_1220391 [Trametes polyzona]
MRSPFIPPIPSTSAPLHIRIDPHAGRKYHASAALPAGTDLLGRCTPYSYTIWKRFRNEVCAECWRYDGGRRTFLTRRDDEGYNDAGAHAAASPTPSAPPDGERSGSTSAGLWFCDATCQGQWIAREGLEAVDLLRQLEAARQKKPKPKPKAKPNSSASAQATDPDVDPDVTPEAVERAWDVVREGERSPKEMRRWRDLQLEDYEADMARYVLLALHRCYREQCQRRRSTAVEETQSEGPTTVTNGSDGEPSEWQTFASLQVNEQQLLNACPQILAHQTRIYQLLKGKFGSRVPQARSGPSSRSSSSSVSAQPRSNGGSSAQPPADEARTRKDAQAAAEHDAQSPDGEPPHLADLVTIANVRTILGVDPGNAFGIWEVPVMEESECLGFALYPVASFFNHHCAANVRKERDGRTLRFVTTRAVEAGEELCISYGHIEAMDVATRRKELLEGWYFECMCSRCTAEAAGEGTVTRT